MNERIKEVRKINNLNQEKFGERLGVTKAAISKMELKTYNVTDTMIKLICTEFNINEEWLRYGRGNMFIQADTFSLDEYAKKNHLTSLELNILKGYMELDEDIRKQLISHFENIFVRHSEISAITDDLIEVKVDNYRNELKEEQKGKTLSVLLLQNGEEKIG